MYLPASVFTLHSVFLVLPLVVSDWYMVGQVEHDVAVPPAEYVAPVQIEHVVPLTTYPAFALNAVLTTDAAHVVAPLDAAVCLILPDAQPAGVGLVWTQLVCDFQPVPVESALAQPLVSAGHAVHDDIPVLAAYVQFAHVVGAVADAAQDEPAGQIVQDVAVVLA